MNGLGGYILRRVLGALAVAAAFAVLGWFQSAHAYPATVQTEGAPGTRYEWALTLSGPWSGAYISKPAACQANPAPNPPYNFTTFYSNGTYGTECLWNVAGGGQGGYGRVQTKGGSNCSTGYTNVGGVCTKTTCPGGGTLSGTTCNCVSPQVESGSTCITPPTCEGSQVLVGTTCTCPIVSQVSAGTVATPTGTGGAIEAIPYPAAFEYTVTKDQWTAAPATASGGCYQSCAVSAKKSGWVSGTGYYTMSTTGGLCSGTSAPSISGTSGTSTSTEESKCIGAGGAPVTVGGVTTCVNKKTAPDSVTNGTPSTSTKTVTNPDGSRTETTTTQTPVTVCMAGACTTTITTTTSTTTFNSGGTPTGTTTESQTVTNPGGSGGGGGEGGNCDPAKEQCGEGSSFGGSCEAGFTCDGDAIQCAIARQQHQAYCAQFGDVGTGMTKAEALADWTASSNGLVTGTGRVGNTSVSGSTAFVTTERAYGAGSLADWNVSGITIPLSHMNTPLSYLGYIVLVFSTLWGAQIMFGAGRLGS